MWEAMGGGPADLFFPEEFMGTWRVTSTLIKLETPLGDEMVPDPRVIERARRQDLNFAMTYAVTFRANSRDKVIFDRAANTAAMLKVYYADVDFGRRIDWNPEDPNVLELTMPGGLAVRTRVTRRSEEFPAGDRLETSEYVESVYQQGEDVTPKVKASQCYTKYKWRSASDAALKGGPTIVATQVVSEYLTPYDGEQKYLATMNQPYAQYTYRMAFTRTS